MMYYIITKYLYDMVKRKKCKRYYTGVKKDPSGLTDVNTWGGRSAALRIPDKEKAQMIARHIPYAKLELVKERGDKANEE